LREVFNALLYVNRGKLLVVCEAVGHYRSHRKVTSVEP
jgi:hypothetical protein